MRVKLKHGASAVCVVEFGRCPLCRDRCNTSASPSHREVMCLHRAVSTHPQARASFLSIHPTTPARFLVARCPRPSPQDPSSPLGAFSRTPCLPHPVRPYYIPVARGRSAPGCRPDPNHPTHTVAASRGRWGAPPLRACLSRFPQVQGGEGGVVGRPPRVLRRRRQLSLRHRRRRRSPPRHRRRWR